MIFTENRRGGGPARWLMIESRPSRGGVPHPRRQGLIPARKPTPRLRPNLQPGALVRIKSYQEILSTLDMVYSIAASPLTPSTCLIARRSIASTLALKISSTRRLAKYATCERQPSLRMLLRLAVSMATYVLPPAIYPRWRENCFNESPTASHCTATLAQGTYYKRACRRRRARRIVPRMFSSSFRKFIAGPQPVSCSSGPFASASPRMPAQFLSQPQRIDDKKRRASRPGIQSCVSSIAPVKRRIATL